MKDAIILGLVAIAAWLAIGQRPAAEAQIEDTTLRHAAAVPVDYPLSVTVKPAPLLRSPEGRLDYRPGEPSNDRGVT